VPDAEILTAATIRTMDPTRPLARAIGIRAGLIEAVGSLEEVRGAMGAGVSVTDLGDGVLLPGFIDAHHHLAYAALDYGGASLRLAVGSGIDDLLARIATAVAEKPPGWVYLCGYEAGDLRERRAPTADELEQCAPGRPLFVQAASGHDGVLNRSGLQAMGWSASSPDPPNGVLARDRRGRLTGVVSEAAAFMAEATFRDQLLSDGPEVWMAACEAHARDLLALGITRVGDAAVAPSVERLYQRAAVEGRLPLTVHAMPVASSSLLLPRFDGPATGEGHRRAPIGPAKLYVDGGHRCAVCLSAGQAAWVAGALLRNVIGGGGLAVLRAAARSGRPRLGRDLHLHAGMRFWHREELSDAVAHGAERGFQIALHAIGNEAIDLALVALERNQRALAEAPGRPRLEHVVFAEAHQPQRIAESGAMVVVQPAFIANAGDDMLLTPLPPSIKTLPLRSLSDAGVELAGSSDYPVTQPDVLAAIGVAATRRTAAGAILEGAQATWSRCSAPTRSARPPRSAARRRPAHSRWASRRTCSTWPRIQSRTTPPDLPRSA
jgi:predicted amidohydrolase YtcJ